MEPYQYIDRYFENKIRSSLYRKTSGNFSDLLLEKIDLDMQFAREDKKADNVFKTLVFSIITAMVLITTLVVYYAAKSGEQTTGNGNFSTFLTDIYTKYGFGIIDTLGINFDSNLIIFIPVLAVFLIVFSLADRKIFKRS